jgi:hypothetical protein
MGGCLLFLILFGVFTYAIYALSESTGIGVEVLLILAVIVFIAAERKM